MGDDFFVLGYWCNAYRPGDREYFWIGMFEDRKHAAEVLKRKKERGQPKTFIDWCGAGGKVIKGRDAFIKAAQKVGMNPNMENLYYV